MKIINFIKRDFWSVHSAMKLLTNEKLPTWVIVIYYVVLAPFCFLISPLVLMYVKHKITKIIREMEEDV
jgi:hypothetical protein